MSKEKVVLAYSGGLDTSDVSEWLRDEKNLDVVCVCGNVGRKRPDWMPEAEALDLGVLDCRVLDLRDEFSDEFLTKGHRRKLHVREQVPAALRSFPPAARQKLVEVAHEFGATYVAHGCTGKGNDQVRLRPPSRPSTPSSRLSPRFASGT